METLSLKEGRSSGVITDQAPKPGMTVDEDTPVDLFFEESKETGGNILMIFGDNKRYK